jgi:hypothetical protein
MRERTTNLWIGATWIPTAGVLLAAAAGGPHWLGIFVAPIACLSAWGTIWLLGKERPR